MNEKVKNMCDLIMENRNALKKKMFWEVDSNTYAVMAGILTAAKGIKADPEKYKKCKELLHKKVGAFSELRGTIQAVVITKMMTAEDPEAYADGVIRVHGKLREIHKLTASPYMVMAAINIYEHCKEEETDGAIEKLEALYKNLNKKHPLLIGDSDRGYLSMIAVSDIDPEELSENIENTYEACKKISLDKDSVNSMAQVMALSDMTPERKYEFVDRMINGLKEKKSTISKSYGLTTLGALSLLGIPEEQLIEDIADAGAYLKGNPGFKWYDSDNRLRIVYAALAVFLAYAKDNEKLAGLISANLAINITEEIIIMIIILIVSMSVASSASH